MKFDRIKDIKLDIDFRKKEKKKIDSLINLSVTNDDYAIILNECINLDMDRHNSY